MAKLRLDRGDILLVRAAVAELPRINLGDELRICLVFRTSPQPGLYERAAVRRVGRFCLKAEDAQLAEIEQAAVALGAIPAHPEEAYAYLVDLCEDHGLHTSSDSGPTTYGRLKGGAG